MKQIKSGNLFSKIVSSYLRENFSVLLRRKGMKLERIVSQGQRTPPGKWLKGAAEEWVILLKGKARLTFETGESLVMEPGDYVLIPAKRRHRVEWTSPRKETVWLAIHYPSSADFRNL